MSYRKLALAFAAAVLASPMISEPAYALTGGFVFKGTGSFAYSCTSNSPIGSNVSYDAAAKTFSANVGAMTCTFTLDDTAASTVEVPFNLNVLYNNVNINTSGNTTTISALCPASIYPVPPSSFAATGACKVLTGDPNACTTWQSQMSDGAFHFQTPWVGAPKGQVGGICDTLFDAQNGFLSKQMAAWSVTQLSSGGIEPSDPLVRFCATPLDPSTGVAEPCSEIQGTGQDRFLYVRGAAGEGVIVLIATASEINTWNLTNPQQGNLNILFSPNAQVDPHNFSNWNPPAEPDGPKIEGILASSCSDNGTTITCHFPSSQLAPLVQDRIVNGQVLLNGTAKTVGGTRVQFTVLVDVSGN